MATNPHFSLAGRNSALDVFTTSLGTSALLQIYAGNQPADVSSAVSARRQPVRVGPRCGSRSSRAPAPG